MARMDVSDAGAALPRPLVGIALKVAATLAFGLMAAIARGIGDAYPLGQVVFFRSSFAFLPILATMLISGVGLSALATKRPWSHLLRSGAGTGAMFSYFAALVFLPLADVTALSFVSPLIITALAALILGEHVGLYRWSAVALGFVGVLIMISPHLGHADAAGAPTIGLALAFASATFASFAMISVRRMSGTENALAIAFYFQLTCTVVSMMTLPFAWVTPTVNDFGLLVLIGVCGGCGQILMTNSYRFATASTIANFDYVAMIWAILFGWMFFDELPAAAVYVGAAIVIGSGAFIAWRERNLGLAARAPAPEPH